MLSPFFLPVEHMGHKFDRGCILFEFDAMREPEKTQFPLVGKFVRSKIRMVEIRKPQIVYREPMPFNAVRYMPDYFIANDTKAWLHSHSVPHTYLHPSHKHQWSNDVTYDVVSLINHPRGMHEAFETWCQKLYGFGLDRIVAKYHRAAWLPLYWPESFGTVWPTKFYYPVAGHAGALAEVLGTAPPDPQSIKPIESVDTAVAYCLATTVQARSHSVFFVLDRCTPIYRITDQTACAGWPNEIHRLVVEYREEPASIERDLAAFGYEVTALTVARSRLVPPTRANVEAGYRFDNHLNSQLMEYINATACA